jgi:hypothetical protein
VRNSFVILFSVDVSAAEVTSIAKTNVNRTIIGPQMDLPKSLLDFMIAPLALRLDISIAFDILVSPLCSLVAHFLSFTLQKSR